MAARTHRKYGSVTQRRFPDDPVLAPDTALGGGNNTGYGGMGSTRRDHSGGPMSTMTQYEQKQQAMQAVQAALDRRDGGGSSQ